MTYCVGLKLNRGLVMMSDTRTNAGVDNISVFRKMFLWEAEGERSITLMTAGNLATTQAVVSLLNERAKPADERGAPSILEAPSMFQAARLVGETLREVIQDQIGVAAPGRQPVLRHADPRRAGARRRAAAFPDLSRGQFRRGQRRHALLPDRRDEIRQADPGARLRSGHELRGCGEAPDAQLRFDDQGQSFRGPAARPSYLRDRQFPATASSAASSGTTRFSR
jgi:hypothetical protein